MRRSRMTKQGSLCNWLSEESLVSHSRGRSCHVENSSSWLRFFSGGSKMRAQALTALAAVVVLCACEGSIDRGEQEVLASVHALVPSPDSDCEFASSSGRDYWFCDSERSWQAARTKCQAIGLDLARIDNVSENTFIYNNVTDNSWIGASDATVEGTWRWVGTNTLFWTGGASGTAAPGIYTKWKSGQPANTSNQDCGMIEDGGGGFWNDESCGSREYVCEGIVDLCPSDISKTVPGQCGCGNPETNTDGDSAADCVDGCDSDPGKIVAGTCGCGVADTDGDGDGTANCIDGCPADSQKSAPGVCGCGVVDGDADGDGAINCEDQCPQDPAKTTPGDCGCANAPKPSGTACADGLCVENTQCNGSGRCGNSSQCENPDSDCELHMLANVPYWFCDNDRPFADARTRCQSAGMDLVSGDRVARGR